MGRNSSGSDGSVGDASNSDLYIVVPDTPVEREGEAVTTDMTPPAPGGVMKSGPVSITEPVDLMISVAADEARPGPLDLDEALLPHLVDGRAKLQQYFGQRARAAQRRAEEGERNLASWEIFSKAVAKLLPPPLVQFATWKTDPAHPPLKSVEMMICIPFFAPIRTRLVQDAQQNWGLGGQYQVPGFRAEPNAIGLLTVMEEWQDTSVRLHTSDLALALAFAETNGQFERELRAHVARENARFSTKLGVFAFLIGASHDPRLTDSASEIPEEMRRLIIASVEAEMVKFLRVFSKLFEIDFDLALAHGCAGRTTTAD